MPPLTTASAERQSWVSAGWLRGLGAGLVGSGALVVATGSAAEASMLLKVWLNGPDLYIQATGSIDTSILTEYTPTSYGYSGNGLSSTQLTVGGPGLGTGADAPKFWGHPTWTGPLLTIINGTSSIAPVNQFQVNYGIISDSGTTTNSRPLIVLPASYASTTTINKTSYFTNTTPSALGLTTRGTQTWTFGDVGNVQSVTIDTTEVPAPLGFASAAIVFSSLRRLQRNTNTLKQFTKRSSQRSSVSAV